MTEPVSSSLLTCRDLIQSIVAAVDARDVYTAHHSDRLSVVEHSPQMSMPTTCSF